MIARDSCDAEPVAHGAPTTQKPPEDSAEDRFCNQCNRVALGNKHNGATTSGRKGMRR